ncbi:Uncharacterised protein [Mycobacteroides abscessus subsp. abscessus]|nr:Uncharacterised protein [Mycobacteroides abscessus subsp. abscessus]
MCAKIFHGPFQLVCRGHRILQSDSSEEAQSRGVGGDVHVVEVVVGVPRGRAGSGNIGDALDAG